VERTRIDQLPKGRLAVIAGIDREGHDPSSVRRLYEMGFDEGVDVEVLHRGPVGGCPIALRVGNMTVALRRAQAAMIAVEPMREAAE
jgi:ferrous iron transport protein A